eukprot:749722-Hanusia_phi.AAC.1
MKSTPTPTCYHPTHSPSLPLLVPRRRDAAFHRSRGRRMQRKPNIHMHADPLSATRPLLCRMILLRPLIARFFWHPPVQSCPRTLEATWACNLVAPVSMPRPLPLLSVEKRELDPFHVASLLLLVAPNSRASLPRIE